MEFRTSAMGCRTVPLDNYFPSRNDGNIGNLRNIIQQILLHATQECPDTADLMNFYQRLSPIKLTNESILKELTWIAYAGGFRYDIVRKYWPKITEALFEFDVIEVALLSCDLDKQAQIICDESGFKNIRKAKWCILNAQRILELDCELRKSGGLKGYFVDVSKMDMTEIIDSVPVLLDRLQFKGIGKTTVFHLLKNLGIDIFKPDIHVCRMLYKLGLVNKEPNIYEICDAMRALASSYGLKVSELDTLFFVYGKTTSDYVP